MVRRWDGFGPPTRQDPTRTDLSRGTRTGEVAMLPPVLASPNSYTTAPEAKPRSDQPGSSRATALPAPQASTAVNQNSAIAGQLNIMLLSGPERMSQNLAALADILGSALKVERRADENLNDYMGRLIDGIAALPASDRAALQKLLTQSFAGLQLRTLLEAMANPSGPERATLALYLELYRQTDRDGAIRSVISSYREVAGDSRAMAPSALRPSAGNDIRRVPTDPERPAPNAIEQRLPSRAPATEAAARAELPLRSATVPRPDRPGMVGAPSTRVEMTSSSFTPRGYDIAVMDPESSTAAVVSGQSSRKSPTETGPARPAALAGQTSPVAEEPLALAEPGRRLASVPRPEVVTPSDGRAAEASRTVAERPTSSATVLAPVPSLPLAGQASSVLSLPSSWLAELLESDLIRTLLQLKMLSTAPQTAIRPGAFPGTETPAATGPAAETKPSETASEAAETAPTMPEASLRDLAEERPLPGMIPLSEQGLLRLPIAREGMPIPFIPYRLDDDFDVQDIEDREEEDADHAGGQNEGDTDEGRRDETDDVGGNGPEEAEAVDGRADAATPMELPAIANSPAGAHALPAPVDTAVRLPPEPAHELYLRMAGLT